MRALLYYPDNMVKGTILPPYPLLYLARALINRGHDAVIFDGRFGDDALEDEISRSDLLAVSAGMNLQFATALPVAKLAKDYKVPVLFGGVFATLNHTALLKYPNIDGICRGEGEIAIVDALENGIKKASNVAYLDGGVQKNPKAPFVKLDDYSPLPWELIDMQKYVVGYKGLNLFYFATSRGCPHRCDYCYQKSFWDRSWRALSFEKAKEEIDTISESVDIDGLYFFDDNFFVNKSRAIKITRHVHEKGLKWSCMTRANYLDEPMVKHMKDFGCFKLNIGAESGSSRTLERMKKDISTNDISEAARLIGKAGLNSEFYFMIGYQGETMEDINLTVEMADEVERLCDAETFIRVAIPFKGTHYFESASENGFSRGDDLMSMCTEDWGRHPPNLPWFTPEENRILKTVATLSEIRFMKKKFLKNMPLLERLYVNMIFPLLKLRWKRRIWKNVYELAPYEFYENFQKSRMLNDSLKIARGMDVARV